jgi:hypothetical protein
MVNATAFTAGGMIVTEVGILISAMIGTVMVFAPEARDLSSICPGLSAFTADVTDSTPTTSPAYAILEVLVLETDISDQTPLEWLRHGGQGLQRVQKL